MRILDVGCGVAPLCGDNVIHTDINVTDFNRKIVEVRCDAHNLPFRNTCFDLINCSHVLEHCINPLQVLKELQRVTKRKVVIKVPSLKSTIREEASDHFFTWSKSSFRHLLNLIFSKVTVYETNRAYSWVNHSPFFSKTLQLLTHAILKNELTAICEK